MNEEINKAFSETLREVRCGKKVSFQTLAEHLGVHRETVRRYENNPKKMEVWMLLNELYFLNENINIFLDKIMAKSHKKEIKTASQQ